MRLLVIVEVPDSFIKQIMQSGRSDVSLIAPHRIQIEWGETQIDGWVQPIGYVSNHRYPDDFRVVPTVHDLPEQVAERVVLRMGDELAKVFRKFGLRDVVNPDA